jgi:hypothetical protein
MLRLQVIWATKAQACTIPIGSCSCRKDVNFKALLLYHIIIIFWHHHTKTKYSYKPMVTYVQPPDQCTTSYYNPPKMMMVWNDILPCPASPAPPRQGPTEKVGPVGLGHHRSNGCSCENGTPLSGKGCREGEEGGHEGGQV